MEHYSEEQLYCFLNKSILSVLGWYTLLHRPCWSRTHRDLSGFASQKLGLKTCAATPSFIYFYFMYVGFAYTYVYAPCASLVSIEVRSGH